MMNTAKLRSRGEAMKDLGDDILSMRVGGDSLRIIGNQLVLAAECIEQQNDIIRSLGGNYEGGQANIKQVIARLDDLFYRLDKPIRTGENPQYDYQTFQNEVYLNWHEISKATRQSEKHCYPECSRILNAPQMPDKGIES